MRRALKCRFEFGYTDINPYTVCVLPGSLPVKYELGKVLSQVIKSLETGKERYAK